jgi:hypothetical protein
MKIVGDSTVLSRNAIHDDTFHPRKSPIEQLYHWLGGSF